MRFYAGRWNYIVYYGSKIDLLEAKLNGYSYRYRIGDYVTINNRKELKELSSFKEGDMYVCKDEVWVCTGEEYVWYRYKVIINENRLMQRIKVVGNSDVCLNRELDERTKYIIKPSHEQRKKNKKNGGNYLTKCEKNSIKLAGLFIIMSIIVELIRIIF